MNYEDFKERLLKEIKARKPDYVKEFLLIKVRKDNVNEIDALTVKYEDNRNVCPTVYVKDFYQHYQNGQNIDELADNIIRIVGEEQTRPYHFGVEDITPENAKKCLTLQLINKEWNEDIVSLCAYMELETNDLIAVPRWNVSMGEYTGSFLVTHDIQKNILCMSDEELLRNARKNVLEQSNFVFQSLAELLREMGPEFFEVEEWAEIFQERKKEFVYVLTNKEKLFGAVALLSKDILGNVHSKIGEDFYIIPSSKHEVLIIPESDWKDPGELHQLCHDINERYVEEIDRLGDNIYRFDGGLLKICNSMEEASLQRGDSVEMEQEMSLEQGMVL